MSTGKPSFHESYRRGAEAKAGTERAFGVVFCIVFAIVGLWPLWSGESPRLWALGVALAFGLAAFLLPAALRPLNRLWFRFGMLLHRVVSPLILGLLFFVTVMPIGLAMRALGKDPLRLRFEPGAASYWIERRPPGPDPATMAKQF